MAEAIERNYVGVVEEKIVLGGQLYFYLFDHVVLVCALEQQYFYPDGFKGAYFLGAVFRIVDAEFEGCGSVEKYGVAFLQAGVEFINRTEIEIVKACFLGLFHFLFIV